MANREKEIFQIAVEDSIGFLENVVQWENPTMI